MRFAIICVCTTKSKVNLIKLTLVICLNISDSSYVGIFDGCYNISAVKLKNIEFEKTLLIFSRELLKYSSCSTVVQFEFSTVKNYSRQQSKKKNENVFQTRRLSNKLSDFASAIRFAYTKPLTFQRHMSEQDVSHMLRGPLICYGSTCSI